MNAVNALLDKAERSLKLAERILQGGKADFAASRAYYALFYTAEALLLSRGLRFSSHKAVIAQYGQHFAKTGLLDSRFHSLLQQAFQLRQLGDYAAEANLDSAEVQQVIQEGWAFLGATRAYLSSS